MLPCALHKNLKIISEKRLQMGLRKHEIKTPAIKMWKALFMLPCIKVKQQNEQNIFRG